MLQALKLAQADAGIPGDNSVMYIGVENANDVAKNFSKYIPNGHLCLSNSNDKLCNDLKHNVLLSAYKDQYGPLSLPAIILPDNGVIHFTLSQKCVDTVVENWLRDPVSGEPLYNDDGTPKVSRDIRNACGSIFIDVNGSKNPNKFGYDAFGVTVWADNIGKPSWNVYGTDSLFSILSGGELKYNTNE